MNRAVRLGAIATATCATIAVVGLAGSAGASAATPAPTAPSSTSPAPATASAAAAKLATIQAAAKLAVANRTTALNDAIPEVSANKVITDADRATLLTTLNSDLNAITALGPKIAADSTVAQASTDYRTIFTGYRVFALALPQVRYAEAADDLAGGVVTNLSAAQSTLAGLLAGPDSAKNSAAVQAEMSDLGHQISAITAATNGLSATVLADTPAQYDANHNLLSPARAAVTGARADAKTARSDVADVLKALQ
jgi:hypothetical protein